MTQFKETDTFQDLQTKVYDDIVGLILTYLKEAGVPEEKLSQVSDNLYRDLFAVMSELGIQQVPGAELYADKMKSTLKEKNALEARIHELAKLEEKDKEIAVLQEKVREMAAMEEKLRGMAVLKENQDKEIAALEEKVNELESRKVGNVHEPAGDESPDDDEPELVFDSLDSILEDVDSTEEDKKDMDDTTTDPVLDMDEAQKILKGIKSS